ncbi:MAG: hypothetical protein NC230_09570, partial [Bacteroides sp.]|nr:hypothetical protein [Bacteroides sp.]
MALATASSFSLITNAASPTRNQEPQQTAQTDDEYCGEVTILYSGEGEIEIWSGGSTTEGASGKEYAGGDQIPASGFTPCIFF